jgi:hypothetical protein
MRKLGLKFVVRRPHYKRGPLYDHRHGVLHQHPQWHYWALKTGSSPAARAPGYRDQLMPARRWRDEPAGHGQIDKMVEVVREGSPKPSTTRLWGALALTGDKKTLSRPARDGAAGRCAETERTASRRIVSTDAEGVNVGLYDLGFTHRCSTPRAWTRSGSWTSTRSASSHCYENCNRDRPVRISFLTIP